MKASRMEIKITIETENAAFGDGFYYDEIRAIVSKFLERIECGAGEYPLHDTNGNKVGSAIVEIVADAEGEDEEE